jgi:hypothetical protein
MKTGKKNEGLIGRRGEIKEETEEGSENNGRVRKKEGKIREGWEGRKK